MIIRLAVGACIMVLGAASFVEAQSDIIFERQLDLTLTPAHPAPGQTVQLSIQTYALDLRRSMVVWYVNDREILRGIDRREASVVVGNLGTETAIRVIAEDEEGLVATAEAIIRPTEIDLLWEADSYVPPFYGGRTLPGTNSTIRAQAIARFRTPSGAPIDDSNIVYTWYRNDAIVADGRGKSSVTVSGPSLFGADTLRVVAVSADKTLSAETSVRIPAVDPFVMLHENHPLFGVLYHRSLEPGATTLETEQKVTAVPYFADIVSPGEPSLLYEWTVNGATIAPDPEEPQTLTITAEGYTGPADIELSLMSARDIFLHAVGKWQLVFGEQSRFFSGLNPFGQ
ncbi:MAG TPA: hypothetical protein VNM40_04075 [Candidatus Paceibacterota bacterium]|nr:hypothetical protein [Candidatus Paceibacterota bacterium]